jgi:hypothetical protein
MMFCKTVSKPNVRDVMGHTELPPLDYLPPVLYYTYNNCIVGISYSAPRAQPF